MSILSKLRNIVADPDIAIDLGTANTRMYALGRGLIADEPSIVNVEASGDACARGRAPLRGGVIVDLEAATALLLPLLERAHRFGFLKPRTLACAPTDASKDERALLVEAARCAGAADVKVIPEPLAAAIGAGLDISSPYAQMLVDIGDGVTDIAVIRSSTLLSTSAVRTACSDLHQAIEQMIAARHQVLLHPGEAERLTRAIKFTPDESMPVKLLMARGICCERGGDASVLMTSDALVETVAPVLDTIIQAIVMAVRDLPPMVSVEVIENGICLTGGGAVLDGLADQVAAATNLDVHLPKDPLHTVINGASQMLNSSHAHYLWA